MRKHFSKSVKGEILITTVITVALATACLVNFSISGNEYTLLKEDVDIEKIAYDEYDTANLTLFGEKIDRLKNELDKKTELSPCFDGQYLLFCSLSDDKAQAIVKWACNNEYNETFDELKNRVS